MVSFLSKEQVTNEERRKLLICAYKNIMAVYFDLRYLITSDEVLCDKEVSLILNKYRLKVESERERESFKAFLIMLLISLFRKLMLDILMILKQALSSLRMLFFISSADYGYWFCFHQCMFFQLHL